MQNGRTEMRATDLLEIGNGGTAAFRIGGSAINWGFWGINFWRVLKQAMAVEEIPTNPR